MFQSGSSECENVSSPMRARQYNDQAIHVVDQALTSSTISLRTEGSTSDSSMDEIHKPVGSMTTWPSSNTFRRWTIGDEDTAAVDSSSKNNPYSQSFTLGTAATMEKQPVGSVSPGKKEKKKIPSLLPSKLFGSRNDRESTQAVSGDKILRSTPSCKCVVH